MTVRFARWDWNLVVIWFLVVSVVLLLQSWLFEASFVLALVSLPALLVAGLCAGVTLLVYKAWKAAIAFVGVTVAMFFMPLDAMGQQAWTQISFAQHRSAYEKIVRQGPNLPAHGRLHEERYSKDGDRIAFVRSQGMPDGWSGVVYDPANRMPLERGSGLFLFGSSVQSCKRIERDWYRCWFD